MKTRRLHALLREADQLCALADRGNPSGAARLAEIGEALAAAGFPAEGAEVRQMAWWVGWVGVTAKVRAAVKERERKL